MNIFFAQSSRRMQSGKLFVLALFLLSITFTGNAQYDDAIYRNYLTISPSDSLKLYLDVQSISFLDNYEYFNNFVAGYTLIGFHLTPELVYQPTGRLRIKGGAHLLKYHGKGTFSEAIPVFSLEYQLSPSVSVIFGSIYGSSNHRMTEPLYHFERAFVDRYESGLQFLIKTGRLWSDIWLNWEQFILSGDPFQEEFTAGFSSLISLSASGSRTGIHLPIQALINHRGGQIDSSTEPVFSGINTSSGLLLRQFYGEDSYKHVDLSTNILSYWEPGSSPVNPFSKGYAFYSNLIVHSKYLSGGVGYWYGDSFISLKGNPVYQSVSERYPGYGEEIRKLLTSRIIYSRRVGRELRIGLQFQVYYDLINQKLDHRYGFHLLYNQRFLLKKTHSSSW